MDEQVNLITHCGHFVDNAICRKDCPELTLVFSGANLTNMISNDTSSYNYSAATSSKYTLDQNKPEEAVLYFQQGFTNIFNSFISNDDDSDSVDGLLGGSSSDVFGSSSSDPFAGSYDYYTQIMQLQNQQSGSSTSATSLELLNSSANLIDKEAIYSFNGQRLTGTIESVVNDQGGIYFRIEGDLIAMDQLLEVKGGN